VSDFVSSASVVVGGIVMTVVPWYWLDTLLGSSIGLLMLILSVRLVLHAASRLRE
jgi:divalent metal cation (Fe/Co/Zn/Cd) transporter